MTSAQVEFRIAIDLHDFVPPDYCHMLGVLGGSKEDKLVSNSQAFISKDICQRMLHLRNHTQGTSISEPDLDSIFVQAVITNYRRLGDLNSNVYRVGQK